MALVFRVPVVVRPLPSTPGPRFLTRTHCVTRVHIAQQEKRRRWIRRQVRETEHNEVRVLAIEDVCATNRSIDNPRLWVTRRSQMGHNLVLAFTVFGGIRHDHLERGPSSRGRPFGLVGVEVVSEGGHKCGSRSDTIAVPQFPPNVRPFVPMIHPFLEPLVLHRTEPSLPLLDHLRTRRHPVQRQVRQIRRTCHIQQLLHIRHHGRKQSRIQ